MIRQRTPPASSVHALRRMRNTRQRDTSCEVAIRRLLHRSGLRYQIDRAPIFNLRRRRADILFPAAKVAVFVDGCFWHSCPIHGTRPKANQAWWADKLALNRRRDQDTNNKLRAAGWLVQRDWEHEAPEEAAVRIQDLVRVRLR